jgi:hypothetical protein
MQIECWCKYYCRWRKRRTGIRLCMWSSVSNSIIRYYYSRFFKCVLSYITYRVSFKTNRHFGGNWNSGALEGYCCNLIYVCPCIKNCNRAIHKLCSVDKNILGASLFWRKKEVIGITRHHFAVLDKRYKFLRQLLHMRRRSLCGPCRIKYSKHSERKTVD